MSSIEGVFLKYKFCNQPTCDRKNECLRYKRNAPWNTICSVMNRPKCDKGNSYPLFLEFPPDKNELSEDYFGYKVSSDVSVTRGDEFQGSRYTPLKVIKQYVSQTIQFYIEPFVAHSKTVYKIENVPNIFGTDTDKEALDKLIKKYDLNPKHFLSYKYDNWDKVLLNPEYQNKCLVFCDVPEDIEDTFFTKAKDWSKNNIILIRTKRTPEEYKESFVLEDETMIYKL